MAQLERAHRRSSAARPALASRLALALALASMVRWWALAGSRARPAILGDPAGDRGEPCLQASVQGRRLGVVADLIGDRVAEQSGERGGGEVEGGLEVPQVVRHDLDVLEDVAEADAQDNTPSLGSVAIQSGATSSARSMAGA